MANNVVPMGQNPPVPEGWSWDGERWVCGDREPCTVPPWGPWGPPWFGPQEPPWYPGANAGVTFSLSEPKHPIRGHFWWNGQALRMWDGAVWVFIGGSGAIDGGGGGASGAGTVVISATPPGNPALGSQWWDGSQLRMWDGVQWVVIGPGQAAGPVPTTTKTFVMRQPTNLGVGTGLWQPVPWIATPNVDTQLAYDPATLRLRPTKAGIYNFVLRSYFGGDSGGIAIVLNDSGSFASANTEQVVSASSGPAATYWVHAEGFQLMNGTTDFVRAFAWTASGTLSNVGQNEAFAAWLLA